MLPTQTIISPQTQSHFDQFLFLKMEPTLKHFIVILLFMLLVACAPAPTTTKNQPLSQPSQCAYVEGRKDSVALSTRLSEKLKAAKLPVETARAEAYGENCIATDGSIVRFAQREIDFYVSLRVASLKDETGLGEQLEQILSIINQLPPNEVGPNPGYVGVTFQAGAQVQNLWFTLKDASQLLEQGTNGLALYQALLKKP